MANCWDTKRPTTLWQTLRLNDEGFGQTHWVRTTKGYKLVVWFYYCIYCICLLKYTQGICIFIYTYIHIYTQYTLQACISPPLLGLYSFFLVSYFARRRENHPGLHRFFSFKLGLSVNSGQIVCRFRDIFCGKTNELVGSFHFWKSSLLVLTTIL